MNENYYSKRKLMCLGNWEREIRENRKYPQSQLAEKTGSSITSISRFERGEQAISALTFLEAISFLKITYQEYCNLVEILKSLEEES